MPAKIVLTLGKRKLEFTPEEARKAMEQLQEILSTPKTSPLTLAEQFQQAQELELERLKERNRDRLDQYPKRPFERLPKVVPQWNPQDCTQRFPFVGAISSQS